MSLRSEPTSAARTDATSGIPPRPTAPPRVESRAAPRGALALIAFLAGWAVVGMVVGVESKRIRFVGVAGGTIAMAWGLVLLAIETAGLARSQSEESARAADRNDRILGMLEGIARRLDEGPVAPPPPGVDPTVLAIERALDGGDWGLAGSLIEALALARPDAAEVAPLRDRLARGRDQAAVDLAAELEAARAVGDADRVLELHGALAPALDPEARSTLDRDLAGWFLECIQRRLRGGKIQLEVVELATKVSDGFAATVAGASLRRSLPTLRRSVGLCPRCAQPYLGLAQACPVCVATAAIAAPPPAAPLIAPDHEA